MVIDLATRRPVRIPRFDLQMGVPDTTGQRPAALAPLVRSKVEQHALEFRVRWSDLDLNDHANNVCYVEWALETVPPKLRASAFPSRLAIDYRAEVRLGDIVRATRTGIAPGVFSHRVAHAADGRDMAIVETTWAT